MKQITRAVRPEELQPLLDNPPRATLAFVRDGAIQAMPVAMKYDAGRYFVGLAPAAAPPAGRVKLLVDDGAWYFDLRGVWVRGSLTACDTPRGVRGDLAWFELRPEKTAAWHYGRMRAQ
jgi:hypothetical protein